MLRAFLTLSRPLLPLSGCPHRRYSTCGEKTFIIDSTVAIQDFYMKETLRAVYLGIDVSFKTPHLPMKAFYCPYSPLLYKYDRVGRWTCASCVLRALGQLVT